MEYSLKNFASFYSGTNRCAILMFDELVERGQIIPYKIRNKEFSIEVIYAPAFSLKLVFRNVLIEDGRHPVEIQMGNVRMEMAPGVRRLRFLNLLQKSEAPLKESSFIFDEIGSEIEFRNYNIYTRKIDAGQGKIPWYLLEEPMGALLYKADLLGNAGLNDFEKKILPRIRFLYKMFDVFLDDRTKVAYGRSNIYFDQEKLSGVVFTDAEKKAGVSLMEQTGWLEAKQKFLHMGEDKIEFFQSFVRDMTQKEGKALYTWLTGSLADANADYPGPKEQIPDYERNHHLISSTVQQIMAEHEYTGFYPDYRKEKKPAFIEVSQIYERKYTYLNEKKKLELISFLESFTDNCLTVTVLQGSIIGKKKTDIYDTTMTAIDGCFTEQGRRRFAVGRSLVIPQMMEEEEVKALIRDFVTEVLKGQERA